jgi:hypothetical protein
VIVLGGYPKDPHAPGLSYDVPGYIGPRELLERYMGGEVVTRTDALLDESEFIIVGQSEFSSRDRDRLRWMIEHLETVDGKPERIRE